jgi:hypothetical protein
MELAVGHRVSGKRYRSPSDDLCSEVRNDLKAAEERARAVGVVAGNRAKQKATKQRPGRQSATDPRAVRYV